MGVDEYQRVPFQPLGERMVSNVKSFRAGLAGLVMIAVASTTFGQAVCLPAPRLLTTTPMGGKAGTEFEVVITGENLDDQEKLVFSDPRITATPKLNASGIPEPNRYVVKIASDCPVGVYEARVFTRLGLSSARAFSVGQLEEVHQTKSNTTLETAMPLPLNSVCNAKITDRCIDHYKFEAKKGQRIVVDCASRGIDSKLKATVIIADAEGRDLLVDRRGDPLDFSVPEDGTYVIKIHELTYKGGPAYFYRLGVWEQPTGTPIVRQPQTRTVNSFSWPPQGLAEQAALAEVEPNNGGDKIQKISLPCDISGSFYPAADVDYFEFEAKKGEEWWIEVASERLGRETDPSIVVQQVTMVDGAEKLTDVLELTDVPSPVKVSSNGYAYDGPPYNAGTSDILGKLTVPADGRYRLRLTDLFGGTRNDPGNIYRLVVRRAAPDFALVAWALHMELRNGDRNALSKPLALRGGATMALEVIAFRRDGFNGDIDLAMEGLPEGVTASGLKIPAGQSRGLMLVTASEDAPEGFAHASFVGRAEIDGQMVTRPCHLASMSWPVPDAWQEIPSPRLIADVPVSTGGVDVAPITIAPKTPRLEAVAGSKVTVPLVHKRRSEFSGATVKMRGMGVGFERMPAFDLPLTADTSEVVLDLAALKTPPGEYLVSFYGGAVAKYRHRPEQVTLAEAARDKAKQQVADLEAEVKQATEQAATASIDQKEAANKMLAELNARLKVAKDELAAKEKQLQQATEAAKPKDIVDIVVSEPVTICVKPAETK